MTLPEKRESIKEMADKRGLTPISRGITKWTDDALLDGGETVTPKNEVGEMSAIDLLQALAYMAYSLGYGEHQRVQQLCDRETFVNLFWKGFEWWPELLRRLEPEPSSPSVGAQEPRPHVPIMSMREVMEAEERPLFQMQEAAKDLERQLTSVRNALRQLIAAVDVYNEDEEPKWFPVMEARRAAEAALTPTQPPQTCPDCGQVWEEHLKVKAIGACRDEYQWSKPPQPQPSRRIE